MNSVPLIAAILTTPGATREDGREIALCLSSSTLVGPQQPTSDVMMEAVGCPPLKLRVVGPRTGFCAQGEAVSLRTDLIFPQLDGRFLPAPSDTILPFNISSRASPMAQW